MPLQVAASITTDCGSWIHALVALLRGTTLM
jgi:hypothetical protein